MTSSVYGKQMTSSRSLIIAVALLLPSALFDEVLPTAVNAEALVPVHQVPWFLEGDVDGFFDKQGVVVVCLIKNTSLLPKELVVLRTDMLSNG